MGSTADSVLDWQQQVYSFIGETWPKCTNNKYQTPNKHITQDVKKNSILHSYAMEIENTMAFVEVNFKGANKKKGNMGYFLMWFESRKT